jgi:hypothetical protein
MGHALGADWTPNPILRGSIPRWPATGSFRRLRPCLASTRARERYPPGPHFTRV